MQNDQFWKFIAERAIPMLRKHVVYRLRFYPMRSELVRDIVQETLLRLVRQVGRETPFHLFDPDDPFLFRWLRKAADRVVIDYSRSSESKVKFLPFSEEFDHSTTESPEESHILKDSLQHAFLDLPKAQRDVMVLWADGYGYAEIALQLGLPESTVALHGKHAKKELLRNEHLLAIIGRKDEDE